jgi:hypothetical protein
MFKFFASIPDLLKVLLLISDAFREAKDAVERKEIKDKVHNAMLEAKKTKNTTAIDSLLNK